MDKCLYYAYAIACLYYLHRIEWGEHSNLPKEKKSSRQLVVSGWGSRGICGKLVCQFRLTIDLVEQPQKSSLHYHQRKPCKMHSAGTIRCDEDRLRCDAIIIISTSSHPASVGSRDSQPGFVLRCGGAPRVKLIFESVQSLMRYLYIDGWYVINIAKRGPFPLRLVCVCAPRRICNYKTAIITLPCNHCFARIL